MRKHLKLLLIAPFILVLAAVITTTVFAQGGLQFFVPRQVQQIPPAMQQPPPPLHPSSAQIASASRNMDFADIERAAGFAPLIPQALPAGCTLGPHYFDSFTKEVRLKYGCVTIAEKRIRSVEHPYVGPDSAESLTINGHPATLINGSWLRKPGDNAPTWTPGFAPQLVFEQNGIEIRMILLGEGKDTLIHIAESIQ